jgi:hypothetical protein
MTSESRHAPPMPSPPPTHGEDDEDMPEPPTSTVWNVEEVAKYIQDYVGVAVKEMQDRIISLKSYNLYVESQNNRLETALRN